MFSVGMAMSQPALDALREQIRLLEGGPAVCRRRVPCGVQTLDALVGGLPKPGILELHGPLGAGRTRLAASILAAVMGPHGLGVWVDPARSLYPPALAQYGVDLARLLVVCPPADGLQQEHWATEQLLRSGCFPVVVVSLLPRRGSRRSASHQWARAAEHGGSTAVVISERPVRELPAEVRLCVGEDGVRVARDRGGRSGKHHPLPSWPKGCDPWA
jgi:hypothetical protein